MTVIVGIRSSGIAIMGADAGVSIGDLSTVAFEPKIARFKRRGTTMLVGAAGGLRACQIAMRSIAKLADDVAIDAALTEAWIAEGIDPDDDDESATVMIATKNAISIVYANGAVVVPACDFAAIGSGGQVALGALDAYTFDPQFKDEPKVIAELAVRTASRHVAGIREPFFIASTDD